MKNTKVKLQNPLISVIVPCYKETLPIFKECIYSILTQTYKNIELIIVLDNPENVELKKYCEMLAKHNKKVTFVAHDKNYGRSTARNNGFKKAKGTLIAVMDADDVWLPQKLEKQYDFLCENPEYDIIATSVNFIDDKSQFISQNIVPEEYNKNLKKHLISNCRVCNPTVLTHANIIKELPYDNYFLEDYDFFIRAQVNGYSLYVMPDVLVNYRIISENMKRRMTKYRNYVKDQQEIRLRHTKHYFKNPLFWIALVRDTIMFIILGILALLPESALNVIYKIKKSITK